MNSIKTKTICHKINIYILLNVINEFVRRFDHVFCIFVSEYGVIRIVNVVQN